MPLRIQEIDRIRHERREIVDPRDLRRQVVDARRPGQRLDRPDRRGTIAEIRQREEIERRPGAQTVGGQYLRIWIGGLAATKTHALAQIGLIAHQPLAEEQHRVEGRTVIEGLRVLVIGEQLPPRRTIDFGIAAEQVNFHVQVIVARFAIRTPADADHIARLRFRGKNAEGSSSRVMINFRYNIIKKLGRGGNGEVFLVDDGSSDGTGIVVKEMFPEITVIQGNGKLFWNRGMFYAWDAASTKNTSSSKRSPKSCCWNNFSKHWMVLSFRL